MADLKSTFFKIYSVLKSELLQDPAFEFFNDSRQWVERMLDYNVPGDEVYQSDVVVITSVVTATTILWPIHPGKLNRGMSVIESYRLLKDGRELNDDEIFLASALGWCIEWLQAHFLVMDDIMDNSHTRRGQPCWFRLPNVGLIAANDGLLLRNHIHRILKNHFMGKPYYVDLLHLFNEVACALLMVGENLDNHINVKNILVEMGTFFQVQDDYLDCFGAPETIGKIGTDIEDYKCSWLVGKALELSNEEQKKVLYENYGKPNPANVSKVKALYNELNLQGIFAEYERSSYKKLVASIEAHPSKVVQAALKSFLAKIYKRQK
ncbi:hypothetical protein Lal_00013286 [Lupinus albus]|nr:hypothetical protein Lal_00013286 [Lupinus albus]